MDWKTILIVILILYGIFWYSNPDKGKEYIDVGINYTQSAISQIQGKCAEIYDPVCANGTNFDNLCLAQNAGHMNVTVGVCQ